MDWKKGLDRYLTASPYEDDDDFDDFCCEVIENFSDDFYLKNEKWIIDDTAQIDRWFNKLYYKNHPLSYKECAEIIERANSLYVK